VARAIAANPPLLLMDEPFGAVDPINRERLQNEFLRLQDEIRKTIVFVTHDIDEAIKMGDRIAILREGGHLVQYAAPAELLTAPADEFVEGFVGADRALKRLALDRVSDARLDPAGGEDGVTVRPDESLRDALSKILLSGGGGATVRDAEGKATGTLTIAAIEEVARRT
jgi:osmoprotectant transport system ATP-binding protein